MDCEIHTKKQLNNGKMFQNVKRLLSDKQQVKRQIIFAIIK